MALREFAGEKLPRIEPDRLLEVRPVYQVRHKQAMSWANRRANKQFKKVSREGARWEWKQSKYA